MKFSFQHIPEINTLQITGHGHLTKRDFLALQNNIFASSNYHPDMNEVCDFTHCSIDKLTSYDVLQIALNEQRNRFFEGPVKLAFIAVDPFTQQLISEFIMMTKELPCEMALFQTQTAAYTWIKEPKEPEEQNFPNCRRRKSKADKP